MTQRPLTSAEAASFSQLLTHVVTRVQLAAQILGAASARATASSDRTQPERPTLRRHLPHPAEASAMVTDGHCGRTEKLREAAGSRRASLS